MGVVALGAVLLLSGCRTTIDVSIRAHDSGGGTVSVDVELDDEALDAAGGPGSIVLDDLVDSGWTLDTGTPEDAGGYRMSAQHAYRDASELQSVLDSLAGTGVFSGVDTTTERFFAGSRFDLSVTVDLSGDPAEFSDDALTELLGGLPLGYSAEELAAMGATDPGAATMTVSLTGPDGSSDVAELDITSGEASSAELAVDGSHRDIPVLVALVTGAVLVLAGLVVLAVALRGRSAS